MGSRMARRLQDSGCTLTVWNRTRERAADLVAHGARLAKTPAEAASEVDVVMTMLADPSALRSVTEGKRGLAAGMPPTSTHIEMSTVGRAAIAQLAELLPPGTSLLDAPVLGTPSEAQ